MRALVQRVSRARVVVDGVTTGAINRGLCVFLGISHEDRRQDGEKLAQKVLNLRVFPDSDGKMNRSLLAGC
jgi:D-aminoacyl-tRNA deacylase